MFQKTDITDILICHRFSVENRYSLKGFANFLRYLVSCGKLLKQNSTIYFGRTATLPKKNLSYRIGLSIICYYESKISKRNSDILIKTCVSRDVREHCVQYYKKCFRFHGK